MPVYHRPRQAIITEDGGGQALILLLALAVPLLVLVSLVAFVLAHLALLAIAAAVFAAVMGSYIAFTRWLASPGQFEKQFRPHWATRPATRPARALPAPAKALPAPVITGKVVSAREGASGVAPSPVRARRPG